MDGYDLLNYIEKRERQVRDCVNNNSDTYTIFSCPKKYKELVEDELDRQHIGTSPVPSTNSQIVEYVILKDRKEQAEEILQKISNYYEKSLNNNIFNSAEHSLNTQNTYSTTFAQLSFVFGVLSIAFYCGGIGTIFSIVGILLGFLQKRSKEGKRSGMAIAGIILSFIPIGILAVFKVAILLSILQ